MKIRLKAFQQELLYHSGEDVNKMIRERGYGVLQIALDVHMTKMGSYERSSKEQKRDIKRLKQHLENWEDATLSPDFDYACKHVIEVALSEKK
jgi:hypothetical protein